MGGGADLFGGTRKGTPAERPRSVKDFKKVKKRARALRFVKPLLLKAWWPCFLGDNTLLAWVITRAYPQVILGDNTYLST